jgi:antagonist of KipI
VEVFEVVQPGLLTTVQDKGRHGYQQYGVPVSGAMDSYALMVANLLVGNGEGDACLEITVLGPRLRILGDTVVSITGADLSPAVNNNPLPMWEAVKVCSGDTISFSHPKRGCRSYLAVAGGIDVPEVMGSRSTYVKSRLGGLEGRPLRSGDRLRAGETRVEISAKKLPPQYIPEYQAENELRVILGPQDDYFTEKGIQTFLHSEYMISIQADRMGCRLEGPPIEHKAGADIISDGVLPGAVQVPGDGLPIILLADRQTTGGYVKIAIVSTVDLPKLAQAEPGDRVKFLQVTEEEAYQLLREYDRTIDALKQHIQRNDE